MNKWLVLVGGGACGEWSAGAVSALWDAGVLNDLTGIVGTSVGGLNACALAHGIAQKRGYAVLKEAWDRIQNDECIYTPSIKNMNASHPFNLLSAGKNFMWGTGLFSTDPLRALAKDIFGNVTSKDIEQACGLKLLVRAFNYEAGVVHSLNGKLFDMAIATSAIEGAFPSHLGYGDGGAGDNCPIDVALNYGADQIVVIYTGPEMPEPLREPIWLDCDNRGDAKRYTGLEAVKEVAEHLVGANEDLIDQAAQRAIAQGVQIVDCYPAAPTGDVLDFTKRGLWERGHDEAFPAIAAAQIFGWIE